jgi:hypothetical protein
MPVECVDGAVIHDLSVRAEIDEKTYDAGIR